MTAGQVSAVDAIVQPLSFTVAGYLCSKKTQGLFTPDTLCCGTAFGWNMPACYDDRVHGVKQRSGVYPSVLFLFLPHIFLMSM